MKTSFVLALTFVFSFSLLGQTVFHPRLTEQLSSIKLYSEKKDEGFETTKNISELSGSYSNPKLNINDLKYNLGQQTKKKKSVALGVLLSALIPGAGEFYGENYLKAGIFFGVEVLAWGTFIYFTKKGDNQTEDYQKYADTYWDVRTYARWLVNEQFKGADAIDPNEPDVNVLREQIMSCEQQNFSHTMPEYHSQQFYELIGKYQNFQAGWTNLSHIPTKSQGPYWYETYHDPVFTNYAITRQDANDQYGHAKIGVVTAILNHILSAGDAAWTISTYNKRIKVETGFRMDPYITPYTVKIDMQPTFNMKVSF